MAKLTVKQRWQEILKIVSASMPADANREVHAKARAALRHAVQYSDGWESAQFGKGPREEAIEALCRAKAAPGNSDSYYGRLSTALQLGIH